MKQRNKEAACKGRKFSEVTTVGEAGRKISTKTSHNRME